MTDRRRVPSHRAESVFVGERLGRGGGVVPVRGLSLREDFQRVLDQVLANQSPHEHRQVVLAAPPTEAEWDRLHLVFEGVEIPDQVYDLYSIANGFAAGGLDPIGTRLAPLPVEPIENPVWGTPCRPEAQLVVAGREPGKYVVLCEGPNRGEVWFGNADWDTPAVRVAGSLLEFVEKLVRVHEIGDAVTDVPNREWRFVHPDLSGVMAGIGDLRPLEEKRLDGGRPEMYHDPVSPEWELEFFIPLQAEEAAWHARNAAWRRKKFPDYTPVRHRDRPGYINVPPP